jgi:hypothetical protein
VTAVYVTLPEVLVRSGYGGYYTLTAATFLAAGRLASGSWGGARSGYLAGVLAALANHKAALLGAAVAGWRSIRAAADRSPGRLYPVIPVLAGLAAGTAAFWIYGLWTAPADFVADHVLAHGFHRFDGNEALSRAGRAIYPSRPGLWLEFARHFGWLWTGLAGIAAATAAGRLIASLRGAFSAEQARPAEEARPADLQDSLGILVLWIVLGAVVFTVTDWRQTKHLCLLVPAASVALGWLTGCASPPLRWAIRAGLGLSLAWNVWWIVRLARDFESLSISTVW